MNEVTTSTHIYLTIATTCFAWIMIVKPSIIVLGGEPNYKELTGNWSKIIKEMFKNLSIFTKRYFLILFVHIILAIVLPSIYFSENLSKESESSSFVIAKIAALMVGMLIREMFVIHLDVKKIPSVSYQEVSSEISSEIIKTDISEKSLYLKAFQIFMGGILFLNIGEAVYTQIKNGVDGKIIPGSIHVDYLDQINGACGGILMLLVFYMWFSKNRRFEIFSQGNILRLSSNFSAAFIIAYTLWNLLFVIQLGGEVPVFFFFVLTLLLPIIVWFFGYADWLQARSMTLLFFIFITLGMGSGQLNILPMYNKIDESSKTLEIPNDNNLLKNGYEHREFKIFLLVLTCIFTAVACYSEFKINNSNETSLVYPYIAFQREYKKIVENLKIF
jgi:hypothetical protein